MKKLKYYIYGAIGAMALPLALSSCSPDDIDGLNENNLPLAEQTRVTVDVDQETNQVTFNMEGDGIYPIWYMTWESANPYSTVNGYTKIVNNAGDYVLNYRVGNRNGMSQGMGSVTFHIDNSLVNFDMYLTMLSGKTWRIASEEAGHLGCGEPGTDGLGWYSAQPNEKEANGIYDDELTFSSDYAYTYSPGEDGLVFVNTGCTVMPGNPGDGNDFDTQAEPQTATFQLVGEGDDVYLVLPAGTLFPYISCDNQYNDPRFRIESITGSRLVLVYDDGTIAWHYILTSQEAGGGTFDGFDPDSEYNMFKNCTFTNSYYYAPGWTQIADPVMTQDGNSFTFSLPEATSETWQAQALFHTDMTTAATSNYDFSCKLMSTTDHGNVTVKLCDTNNSGVYYFEEKVSLKAYEEYVFYKSDMPGIDISQIDVVFDFGGNAANTDVTVSDIVLKDHANDDGRTPPAVEEDDTQYIYDAETNLWKTHVDDGDNYTASFYYAPGWTQIADPAFTGTGGTYTVALPSATTDQWQAQVMLTTDIPAEADTKYDFSCTLMSDKALPRATVKLTDSADDNNYLCLETPALSPYEEYVVKVPAATMTVGAASALKLVFDFGGNADNTNITINNIVLQKTVE